MAKVTMEFDPAIPGEYESIARLFRTETPVVVTVKSPKDSATAAQPWGKGRKPRASATQPSLPHSKTCDHCGTVFERPAVYSTKMWESRRFCSRKCSNERKGAHSLEISPERDGNGKTKYCQQCGMFLWRRYESRRSTINPDLCDSCGGDDKHEQEFSETPSISAEYAAEVAS